MGFAFRKVVLTGPGGGASRSISDNLTQMMPWPTNDTNKNNSRLCIKPRIARINTNKNNEMHLILPG